MSDLSRFEMQKYSFPSREGGNQVIIWEKEKNLNPAAVTPLSQWEIHTSTLILHFPAL